VERLVPALAGAGPQAGQAQARTVLPVSAAELVE